MTSDTVRRIQNLIDASFAHRQAMTDRWTDAVVPGHPPVLWFGDLARWLAQPRADRVLTAGVNPGPLTFAASPAPWWQGIAAPLEAYNRATARYMSTLEQRSDDRNWFGSYAPVLTALGSSFTGTPARLALHTDICSPLVTVEAWSKVNEETQDQLQAFGLRIWVELVQMLRPSVVIVSVNARQWERVEHALRLQDRRVAFESSHAKSGAPYAYNRIWQLTVWNGEVESDGQRVTLQVVRGSKFRELPFSPMDKARLGAAASGLRLG